MLKTVWVKVAEGHVTHIFKTHKAAMPFLPCQEMLYQFAIGDLRHQCFVRSGGWCELCGSAVTESSGELHEMIHRGKGGIQSLDNCFFVCKGSHKYQHRDRNPRWSKRKEESNGDNRE